jgi:glycosyltransferase involved in cell wall biosynthesis
VNLMSTGVALRSGRGWWSSLSTRAQGWLRDATFVELQWADAIWNAPVLRQQIPGVRLSGLAHDLRSESISRGLRAKRGKPLLEALLARAKVTFAEQFAVASMDELSVFKSSDAEYLRSAGVSTRTYIAPVPLPPLERLPLPEPASRRILFTGAMYRAENVEAMSWFVGQIWPEIKQEQLGVSLRIAGTRPPHRIRRLESIDIEVTGHLPDLLAAYQGIACVVVPLRRGAGIKFKTVEAVAAGYPVVSTSIGAEGVVDASGRPLLDTHDREADFAAAVVRVLREPELAVSAARANQSALRNQASFEARIDEYLARQRRP